MTNKEPVIQRHIWESSDVWDEVKTLRRKRPKLVLSITGDSTTFVPKPWLTPVLKTGLIETARGAKDCVIFNKGSSQRVSSIVRDAIEDFSILQVDDSYISLIGLLTKDTEPYESNIDSHIAREKNKRGVFHDSFKVSANETTYPQFHADALSDIAKRKVVFMKLKDEDLEWKVPVLTIVAEGDLQTIETVFHVLKKNLPVLVLKGSGKAADFISGFIEAEGTDPDGYIKDKSSILFGIISPKDEMLKDYMKTIHENRCLFVCPFQISRGRVIITKMMKKFEIPIKYDYYLSVVIQITILGINKKTKPSDFTDAVTTSVIRGWSHMTDSKDPSMSTNNDHSHKSFSPTTVPEPQGNKNMTPGDDTVQSNLERYSLRKQDVHEKIDVQKNIDQKETLKKNKVHQVPVIMNPLDFDKLSASSTIFMDSYKDTFTLSPLPLYFYIAYQYIQAQENKTERKENFQILLKEAIIADRDEYVSVLLEEDSVKLDPLHLPEIYEKTLMEQPVDDSDFQNIQKWASERAVFAMRKACELKKRLTDNDQWMRDKDVLEMTEKCKTDLKEIGELLTEDQEVKKQLKHILPYLSRLHIIGKAIVDWEQLRNDELLSSRSNNCASHLNRKSDKIDKFVSFYRKNRENKMVKFKDFLKTKPQCNDKFKTYREKMKFDVIEILKAIVEYEKYLKQIWEEIKVLKVEDITPSTIPGKSQVKLIRRDVNIWKNLANMISEDTSKVCIMTGRNICQSLLGFPKERWNSNRDIDGKSAYEDFFVWSILQNRPKLASIFWMKSENQLLCALIASCVYKKMVSKLKKAREQSLHMELVKQRRIFAERALYLQSELYKEEALLAMDLMETKQVVLDITVSPIEFADDNMMLDFISHPSCQRCLNRIWFKELGATWKGVWKKGFFLGCCCCCKSGYRFSCTKSRRVCEPYPIELAFQLFNFISSPLAIFLLHYLFFLAALICYSAFLMVELDTFDGISSLKPYEWIVYVYTFADMLEEYRNLATLPKWSKNTKHPGGHSWWYKLKKYLYNFWNILDVVSYILTIIAIATRSRRFYSLSLFTMYMRFLFVLLMTRQLGPKIIMIKEMLKDLFRFFGILFVFMIGVGVLYHANMYPKHEDMWNQSGVEYWRIWKIISVPYWQIYGDANTDQFEGNSRTQCTSNRTEWENNPDIERCNQYDWILVVIAAFYMLISNLLLVNLVIALFSYRFEKVHQNSEKIYRHVRYSVIMDYKSRIPAPLNLIIRPLYIVYSVWIRSNKKEETGEKINSKLRVLQSVMSSECVYQI